MLWAWFFALFSVVSCQDEPFLQLLQLQCVHCDSIKAYRGSPLCSIPLVYCHIHVGDDLRNMMTSVQDLDKCTASREASYVIFCCWILSEVFEELEAKWVEVIHHDEVTYPYNSGTCLNNQTFRDLCDSWIDLRDAFFLLFVYNAELKLTCRRKILGQIAQCLYIMSYRLT